MATDIFIRIGGSFVLAVTLLTGVMLLLG
ncbi:MAG: hypothetical protein IBGAMO2_70011 [Arenicellales bacterium IbO2]|nr:MAG: hypothetical protein IBGAMO2_70011 [Arenicellales bacterium IbO2]